MADKKQTISLSSLKSSSRGKNIDGRELRDFGNGKTEFDPAANGFFAEEEDRQSDREIALDTFDKQLAGRKAEVDKFNELIDKYDGVLTEEDYLRETGQGYVADMLGLKMTDKEKAEVEAERAANRKKKEEEIQKSQQPKEVVDDIKEEAKVTHFPQQTPLLDDEEDDELDELEKEILAEEDNSMPIARGNEVVGEFNTSNLQKMNGVQPQTVSESFVDPNLTRYKAVPSPANAVEEEVAKEYFDEEELIEKEIMEEETSVESISAEPLPKAPEVETINEAVTGKVAFEAPVKQEQVVDENGLTEEEKDLAALDDDTIRDDDEDDDTVDNYWKKVGAAYAKKVRPAIRKLDLNATVVSSVPVTVNTIVNKNVNTGRTFKWVLPSSGRPYSMKSFTAAELNSLGTMAGTASRAREIIKALWDHIVDGKGDNFDEWCKVTSHKDLSHLWFGVYGACFDGSNYVPYVCDKCKEATISDNLDIQDMIQYKNDEVKAKIDKIYSMEFDPEMGKIMPVSRVQISDSIVIDFKDPSVYDILTVALVDQNTRQKYAEGTAMLPYISNIYFIDYTENGAILRPLSSKVYPGNEAKTLKRRAIEYSMVIRSLNSEEYSTVSNYITEISDAGDDDITYVYPEYTCDHCHETISKVETTPSEMVFTRHRLALTEN